MGMVTRFIPRIRHMVMPHPTTGMTTVTPTRIRMFIHTLIRTPTAAFTVAVIIAAVIAVATTAAIAVDIGAVVALAGLRVVTGAVAVQEAVVSS